MATFTRGRFNKYTILNEYHSVIKDFKSLIGTKLNEIQTSNHYFSNQINPSYYSDDLKYRNCYNINEQE